MNDKKQITLLVKQILGDNEFRNLLNTNSKTVNKQGSLEKKPQTSKIEKLQTITQPKLQASLDAQQLCNYEPQNTSQGNYSSYEKKYINSRLNQLYPMDSDSGEEPSNLSNLQFLDNYNLSSPNHSKVTNGLQINLSTQKYLEQLRENLEGMKKQEPKLKQNLQNKQLDPLLKKINNTNNHNLEQKNRFKHSHRNDQTKTEHKMAQTKEKNTFHPKKRIEQRQIPH